MDNAWPVSRFAASRILSRRSNDIGDSAKAAENRAMKAERLRLTACARLRTVCGMDDREAIFAKIGATGGLLKIERRSTQAFVEIKQRRSSASSPRFSSAADIRPPFKVIINLTRSCCEIRKNGSPARLRRL